MHQKINKNLLFSIFFLSFIGYYVIVLLLVSSGLGNASRMITIPVRGFIVFNLLFFLIINFRRLKFNNSVNYFLLFSVFYIVRLFVDNMEGNNYYQSTSDLVFYYLSFAFLPFIIISSYPISYQLLQSISKSLILAGLLFAIASIFSYQQFIGTVGRLSAGNTNDDSVVSPLILSYCSTLSIGVSSTYLFYNKTSLLTKSIILITIVLSIIPFFLGASRGSLVALFIPFLLMILFKRNFFSFLSSILVLLLAMGLLISLDTIMESGLIGRFTNTSSDIELGDSSSLRTIMWRNSFDQFIHNPIWGDKLAVDGFGGIYPHNIILEVLQATGILGFIPFFILIFKCFKITINIFKNNPAFSWIGVIFLQSFSQNMFSGAIHSSSWLWLSLALLVSYESYSNIINRKNVH